MKYFSKVLFILSLAFCFSSCNDIIEPANLDTNEVPVRISFSMAGRMPETKSKVSGEEEVVKTMQLICFDANGQYLGIRDADVTSSGTSGTFYDTGVIKGTVPQGTSRVHFIANRGLSIPLSHSNGTSESKVMNSIELSTAYNDADHQKVCYWGYHKEDNAGAMSTWLKPAAGTNNIVYMIRDRARVVLTYDPTGAPTPVTKIEWLIHNGRERGYLAPAESNWSNDGYWGNSTIQGHTSDIISTAKMHEYKTCNRYSLWKSDTDNDENNFDVAYQSTGTYTPKPQFLFEDDNEDIDDLKVILRVTYTVEGSSKTVYHVLRLNQKDEDKPDEEAVLYDIVRNNTYYIDCKLLSPDVASYETLKDAIDGEEFVNAEVEIDRSIPDINNTDYTLQIKLPTETTSIVLNTVGPHDLDFVFRTVSDVNVSGSINPDDFDVYWEKEQTFCTKPTLSYVEASKQFQIHTTVIEDQLSNKLQDEWIVVKHKDSGLKRYIHVYVIDQFRYKLYPELTLVDATNKIYKLNFKLPPIEHTQFLPDGSGDPNELIYPESLYPIDIKFTTNTLNAYNNTQSGTNYGLFGVSVEGTSKLCIESNFETGYNRPISSTNYDADKTHWYFQQEDNYWDFWYTYQLKTYPTDGQVEIYFKDVRDNIKYATVEDVGLFLFVQYFGKNYSVYVKVPVTGVSLDKTSANVVPGGTLQLTATVSPSDANNKAVTWESSDTSVATVSDSGVVTVASNATPGSSATITVKTNDGEYTASCVVTVVNEVTVEFQLTNANTVTRNNVTISYSNCDWNGGAVRMDNNTGAFTVSVPNGYRLVSVAFTFTDNAKDLSVSTGTFSRSGNNANWVATTNTRTVTMTHTANRNRPKFNSITVVYAPAN